MLTLGLFTPSLAQELDILKELSIYKDAANFTANQRVEAMRTIETRFTNQNLSETAKILIKDAANTVVSRIEAEPFVKRESLISIGKMMGGGSEILKELLFEDPPFFTVYTPDIHKARLIIDVMGDLQIDDAREALHSYISYIIAHPDQFPINRELQDLLATTVETLFYLNNVATPQFFIDHYRSEQDQTKKSLWTWLLMTFVKDQQIKHSRKRILHIDEATKTAWKALLRSADLIEMDHDNFLHNDFFIALHLLLLITSTMTIEEIIDYKNSYYTDYYSFMSKRRLDYLNESMERISELYRIHGTPSGNIPESPEEQTEISTMRGLTQIALVFLGCFEDLDKTSKPVDNPSQSKRLENIQKYNDISNWIFSWIDSIRFPKPQK